MYGDIRTPRRALSVSIKPATLRPKSMLNIKADICAQAKSNQADSKFVGHSASCHPGCLMLLQALHRNHAAPSGCYITGDPSVGYALHLRATDATANEINKMRRFTDLCNAGASVIARGAAAVTPLGQAPAGKCVNHAHRLVTRLFRLPMLHIPCARRLKRTRITLAGWHGPLQVAAS